MRGRHDCFWFRFLLVDLMARSLLNISTEHAKTRRTQMRNYFQHSNQTYSLRVIASFATSWHPNNKKIKTIRGANATPHLKYIMKRNNVKTIRNAPLRLLGKDILFLTTKAFQRSQALLSRASFHKSTGFRHGKSLCTY